MRLASSQLEALLAIRLSRKDKRRIARVAKRLGFPPSVWARQLLLAELEREIGAAP